MSRLALTPSATAGPGRIPRPKLLHVFARFVVAARKAVARERHLRQLDALSDHLRRDIGLPASRRSGRRSEGW